MVKAGLSGGVWIVLLMAEEGAVNYCVLSRGGFLASSCAGVRALGPHQLAAVRAPRGFSALQASRRSLVQPPKMLLQHGVS